MNGFNNPYYAPQTHYPIQNQPQNYRIIPITNKNEINSFVADFNGTPLYFHNQSNNEIYVKQFDIKTGITTLQEFKRTDIPVDEVKEPDKNIYEKDFKNLNNRLDELYKLLKSENEEKVNKKGSKE